MVISSIHVEKFRAMKHEEMQIGTHLTAIAGRNATMKSTLLGMLSQPFSISKGCPLHGEKTIEGYNFKSQFQEKFKLSSHDIAGEHIWTLKLKNGSFYQGKDFISIKSSLRKAKGHTDSIRFINSEGKQRGMGYIQLPVVYLSLSRLFPIGEGGKTRTLSGGITTEEQSLFVEWYKQILSVTKLSNPSAEVEIKDTKHVFAGVCDDVHDIATNSSGESNVGRILLAILSFKRLKEKYPSDYKAGILLIDELDATLFGFAQTKIIDFLYEKAKTYQIQIIFTTHSPIILSKVNKLQRDELIKKKIDIQKTPYKFENEIIYLSEKYHDDETRYITGENIHLSKELKRILSLIDLQPYRMQQALNVYCEDERAAIFISSIFKYIGIDLKQYVSFVDVDLGWTNYYQLHSKDVPEFVESLIVLDHDVLEKKESRVALNYLKSADNVLFTPEDIEQGMFRFLRSNLIFNEFERRISEQGFYLDYNTCFNEWPNDEYNTTEVKRWFRHLEESIPNVEQLYELWCENNSEMIEIFIDEFKQKYNKLAEKKGMDFMC